MPWQQGCDQLRWQSHSIRAHRTGNGSDDPVQTRAVKTQVFDMYWLTDSHPDHRLSARNIPVLSPHPPLCCSQSGHKAVSPAGIYKQVTNSRSQKNKTVLLNLKWKLRTIPSLRISCCFLGFTCFLKIWHSSELWLWFSRNSSGFMEPCSWLLSLGNAITWAVARKANSDRGHTEGYLHRRVRSSYYLEDKVDRHTEQWTSDVRNK